MYTSEYNIKNLIAGLQELKHQLEPSDIIEICALEKLHYNTVGKYLNGNVKTLPIGKAILDRGREILKKKQTHAA